MEALATLKLDAPSSEHPLAVLLVVDRDHALRAPSLGQEGVEAVERPHVEHALAGEVVGQDGNSVAVVARHPRRVQRPLVEREGVKPERDTVQHGAGRLIMGADRQQVGHLALGPGGLG